MAYSVQLKAACVDDLEIHAYRETKTHRLRITGVTIDGQLAVPTLSFWRSIFGEVGLASCVGARFDEYTWFLRLRNSNPFVVFRYVVAIDDHGCAMLLGVPRQTEIAQYEDGGELQDLMAERQSYQWQAASVDHVPPGFMDGPSELHRPSLN